MSQPYAPPRTRGFTLIEVLISCGLLLLLAAFLIPMLARSLQAQNASSMQVAGEAYVNRITTAVRDDLAHGAFGAAYRTDHDGVGLAFLDNTGSPVTQDNDFETSHAVQVADVDRFAVGRYAMVVNSAGYATLFKITGINGNTLTHADCVNTIGYTDATVVYPVNTLELDLNLPGSEGKLMRSYNHAAWQNAAVAQGLRFDYLYQEQQGSRAQGRRLSGIVVTLDKDVTGLRKVGASSLIPIDTATPVRTLKTCGDVTTPPSQHFAGLGVQATGLDAGYTADVTVYGPDDKVNGTKLTASRNFPNIASGTYRVEPQPVPADLYEYRATVTGNPATVNDLDGRTIRVAYTKVPVYARINVTVDGLPEGVSSQGVLRQLNPDRDMGGLAGNKTYSFKVLPGMYSLITPEVENDNTNYAVAESYEKQSIEVGKIYNFEILFRPYKQFGFITLNVSGLPEGVKAKTTVKKDNKSFTQEGNGVAEAKKGDIGEWGVESEVYYANGKQYIPDIRPGKVFELTHNSSIEVAVVYTESTPSSDNGGGGGCDGDGGSGGGGRSYSGGCGAVTTEDMWIGDKFFPAGTPVGGDGAFFDAVMGADASVIPPDLNANIRGGSFAPAPGEEFGGQDPVPPSGQDPGDGGTGGESGPVPPRGGEGGTGGGSDPGPPGDGAPVPDPNPTPPGGVCKGMCNEP